MPLCRGALAFFIGIAALAPHPLRAVQPPVAERHQHLTVTHGDTLSDDYFWLREKESPEVRAYLEAENAYAEAVMAPTAALQETLYQEMLARVEQTDSDVPYREGDYYYYTRTEAGK
jgi:oligopeptidase B